ncbi:MULTISPECIES: hypothetical protein [unclassified Nocardioides]|uniref:hypothetical protein n=1 Tax=unclassified Nocardioides TaxID=2615069 RepID=UPI0006FE8B36|nr:MULTISPECIES: hypothetical protein [unclassified Nocardioides]KRA32771.1 hypothetical protein ASD81_14770 [Nocardioides sp. Root614]KRA89423.1 hypothetical protein ASD84_15035 [Nocardioides sp. Root682]
MARLTHTFALLAALAVTVGGCSSDPEDPKPDPSAPQSDITVSCDRFDDTAQRITDIQTTLYDGKDSSGDAAAVNDLVAELDALKKDAPDDVDTALTDLGEGFRSARELLAEPSEANSAALAALAPELAADSQTVTTWIISQCGQ